VVAVFCVCQNLGQWHIEALHFDGGDIANSVGIEQITSLAGMSRCRKLDFWYDKKLTFRRVQFQNGAWIGRIFRFCHTRNQFAGTPQHQAER